MNHLRAIGRRSHRAFGVHFLVAFFLCSAGLLSHSAAADDLLRGKQIYGAQCAECHGAKGEGVVDVNESPLHGTKTLQQLVEYIDKSMPEEKPELCRGGDAEKVARYIFDSFYSSEARATQGAARVELARLTVPQYENTLADLLASFTGTAIADNAGGLGAEYFSGRGFNRKERVIERTDAQVSFDFEEGKPDPKVKNADDFSIRWQGSVIAEETGTYEFFLVTENGARLWINQSGNERAVIDAWVSSQGRAKEHSAAIRLIGGRPYPIRLDMFKYKGKTASVSLEWKPPHGARQVIPARNLSPKRVPETFVTTASFPPDDSVTGYPRGTSVSKSWDQATTEGAVEAANLIVAQLDRLSGSREDAKDRGQRVKQFCSQFAERAFRRPLSDAEKRFFVDVHFDQASSIEGAVKRSVLLVLKSPRFLYPSLRDVDDYTVASRLSYGLWDSLPDRPLFDAAARGALHTPEQIAVQAKRMLKDPRAKVKLRGFFHHWLLLDEKEGIVKAEELFPEFDEVLLSDLRTSLDLFLEAIAWDEKSDYRQFTLRNDLYLNERLARFYGVELPAGEGFRKVEFEPEHRAGVLTHPYVMSLLAYHNLSSPIHRGVFLTRRLMGRTLKPPPQATEFKDGDFEPGMTTREKVALITKPAACQSCHEVINPLGFSLEEFDAVGRFRENEGGKQIDSSVTYTTVDGEAIPFTGARDLAQFAASSPQAHGAFVDQLFHHVVKQPINAFGPNVRQDLIESFAAADFNIQELLVQIMLVSCLHEE